MTSRLFSFVNPLVATHTQTHEIALVICAATRQRLSMMHQHCHRSFSQPKVHLAERMAADIAVSDFPSRISVPLMLLVATGKMLIMPLHKPAMFFAVGTLAVRQIGIAGNTARAFRLGWHQLSPRMKKTPWGLLPLEVDVSFTLFHDTEYHVKPPPTTCQAMPNRAN